MIQIRKNFLLVWRLEWDNHSWWIKSQLIIVFSYLILVTTVFKPVYMKCDYDLLKLQTPMKRTIKTNDKKSKLIIEWNFAWVRSNQE